MTGSSGDLHARRPKYADVEAGTAPALDWEWEVEWREGCAVLTRGQEAAAAQQSVARHPVPDPLRLTQWTVYSLSMTQRNQVREEVPVAPAAVEAVLEIRDLQGDLGSF